jgi:membrane protein YqaA with SNARE-associated domain
MPFFFFSYFFYRMTGFYYKQDKAEGLIGYNAMGIISLVQACLLGIISDVTIHLYPHLQLPKYINDHFAAAWGISFLIFSLVNYLLYAGKYQKLQNYWNAEKKHERIIKGWLIATITLGSYLAFFCLLVYYRPAL